MSGQGTQGLGSKIGCQRLCSQRLGYVPLINPVHLSCNIFLILSKKLVHTTSTCLIYPTCLVCMVGLICPIYLIYPNCLVYVTYRAVDLYLSFPLCVTVTVVSVSRAATPMCTPVERILWKSLLKGSQFPNHLLGFLASLSGIPYTTCIAMLPNIVDMPKAVAKTRVRGLTLIWRPQSLQISC